MGRFAFRYSLSSSKQTDKQKAQARKQIQKGQIKSWLLTVFGNQFSGTLYFVYFSVQIEICELR